MTEDEFPEDCNEYLEIVHKELLDIQTKMTENLPSEEKQNLFEKYKEVLALYEELIEIENINDVYMR